MADSLRILHLDDEQNFAAMAATFLEREDDRFTIETVTHPGKGIDRLGTSGFDCIISDYDMPDMNGIEFLETVREDYPDLPVILFTGKGSEDVASEAISAGATDYLQKGSGTDRYELLANRIQNSVEQYHNKQRRETLERTRSIVNDVNQTLVRASSRQQIENQVCEILADADRYRFAVIAEVDEETKQIHPSTWAGKGEEFLDRFEMSVAEDAPGSQAPGGRAFHERDVAIAQDIRSDPTYEHWRDLALEHGFQSLAVVPLDYDAEFYGLLAVLADRAHAFDDSEQEVLEELGDDITHALASLDVRDELRSEKERFRLLADAATDVIVTIDIESTIQFINSAVEDIFGYDPDELIGEPLPKLMPAQYRDRHREALTQFLESGERTLDWSNIELPGLRKDGQEIDLSITFAEFEQEGDRYFEGIIRDTTERKTRERELERYETIAETVRDGICVLNRDSEFVMVNDAFVELTGYSRDELLGRHASVVRPVELNQTFDELQDSLESGSQVESIEMEIETADGSTRVIDARYGQFSHDGETGRVGVWRDITQEKERALELERFQEYTERMRDAIDDLFFVHDTEGNLLEWNTAFTEVTGYSDDEIASMNGIEFIPEEHRERTAAAIEEVFETGHTRLEAPLLTKRGETIPYEYAANRVEHPDGEPRLVGVGRDISERKKREQTIKAREQALRSAYEIIADEDRTIPEKINALLERVRSLIGTDYATFSHIDEEQYEFEAVAVSSGVDLDAGETAPRVELPICERVFQTGQTLVIDDVQAETPELVDPAWDIACYLGVPVVVNDEPYGTFCFYDVEPRSETFSDWEVMFVELLGDWVSSELTRQQTYEHLQRQNEQLDDFCSVVSHDLRNPLNMAGDWLELVREDCESEYLDKVEHAHDRMRALIEDLLTLARETEGVSEIEAVDLAELAENCWNTVETSQATLISETSCTVRADPGRLQQLLENLIRNSVEHGRRDVTLTIGESDNGFYVADDGAGIPEEERDKVFESGYSTTQEGTGFGLSIVQKIVDAHDWEVRVTDGDGGGARFEITGVEFGQ